MDRMLEQLHTIIIKNLKEEFAFKHLSHNLINTIKVEYASDEIKIHIPAEIYDINEYRAKKVVKYTGQGSYASALDIKSDNHTGYINRIIDKSIKEWLALTGNSQNAKVEG